MSETGVSIDLAEASAVITGSTRGIGAEIAKRLAAAGAAVVVSGRTASEGNAVVDEIRDNGGTAMFYQLDVRNPDEIEQVINTTYQEFGNLDILVNNAAFETDTSPEAIDLETWTAMLETDFRAYWLAAKYAYPYLSKSSRGTVINIGSNHSLATHPKKFPYNAIKAGIDGMTRAMAVAWGADGIRVNSVNPGWTMVERINENLTAAEVTSLERIHPVGRIGRPGDIADAVLFFASSMSSFVTGECLVIDGGRSAVLQDDLYVTDLQNEAESFGEPNSSQ